MLAIAGPAAAAVHDAVADFGAANPAGPWSYGQSSGPGQFTPLNAYFSPCFSSGLSCWIASPNVEGTPFIVHNDTAAPVFSYTTVVNPPDVLNLHPGPGTDVVLRFTAPSAGTYAYSGFWQVLDILPNGVTVSWGGQSQLFQGAAATFANGGAGGGTLPFSGSVALAAGETFDFRVARFNDFHFDSTGLSVSLRTIGGVPEPGAWALMILGFGGMGALARRRRRRAAA